MWLVGQTRVRIKSDAWMLFLLNNGKCINTPNPGHKTISKIRSNSNYVELDGFSCWYFHTSELEEVKEAQCCQRCNRPDGYERHCPKCGACPEFQEVRDHSLMWHDGRVHCIKCDAFVRDYDAG